MSDFMRNGGVMGDPEPIAPGQLGTKKNPFKIAPEDWEKTVYPTVPGASAQPATSLDAAPSSSTSLPTKPVILWCAKVARCAD